MVKVTVTACAHKASWIPYQTNKGDLMTKMKLEQLIKKINKENAPPDGWSPEDAVKEDKPEAGKVYALTGGPGSKCIANGYSWADSLVKEEK
jgi:hypothetical protein